MIPIMSNPNISTTIVYIPIKIKSIATTSNWMNFESFLGIDITLINLIIPVNRIYPPTINLIACSTILEKNINIIASINDTIPNVKFPLLGVPFSLRACIK